LLDHLLIEFVARLPERMKRVNGVPKTLLVQALEDLLPREVVYQKKRTFTLPWERWLRGALREQVATGLAELSPTLASVLSTTAVERVWTDFLEGRTTWSRVWGLFVLNEWSKRHLIAN
jgi:asparagine synthase (glutamine-hydrolysing)